MTSPPDFGFPISDLRFVANATNRKSEIGNPKSGGGAKPLQRVQS